MSLSEFELIKRYFDDAALQSACSGLVLGIGDDAAIVRPPAGQELVVAVDTSVAGVHFPADAPAAEIGYRSLAVNLSDLAAMGAQPAFFTLALTLPEADPEWLQAFSSGLMGLARAEGIALVGGDTTRGHLTISIQVQGYVPQGKALRRDGAQLGDLIFVSGSLGEAAAGLAGYQHPDSDAQLRARYLRPTARIALGKALRDWASAAIDVSDGLLQDMGHIAKRSHLAAHIDASAIPLSSALRAAANPAQALQWGLTGGDDYELCFCAPAAHCSAVEALSQELNLKLTCIGEMRAGSGVQVHGLDAKVRTALARAGYQHF